MTQLRSLVALLGVILLIGCMDTANAQPTAAEITTIINRHNFYRNNDNLVVKTNPALPLMAWDAGLAANAQRYLDTCPSGHSSQAYRSNVKSNCSSGSFSYAGENIAWGTSLDAATAINLFGDEQPDYNMADGSCKAGAMCGHWTQVVWRSSVYVGCGKKLCGSMTYYLCQYGPGGNYVGQLPYTPCTSGCPSGAGAATLCNGSPSVPPAAITQTTPKPPTAPTKPAAPPVAPTKPAAPVAPPTKPAAPVAPTKPVAPPTKPAAPPAKPVAPVAPPTKPVAPPSKPVAPVTSPTRPAAPIAAPARPSPPPPARAPARATDVSKFQVQQLLRGAEVVSQCGNGFIDTHEQCDVAATSVRDCAEFGAEFESGVVTCNEECQWDTTPCTLKAAATLGEVFHQE